MDHLPILPILIPMLAAVLMLLPPVANSLERQRVVAFIALLGLVGVTIELLITSLSGAIQIYQLGNWQAPYGIVLVVDRLAILMVLLTGVLALGALLYSTAGDDRGGVFFYPLFMLQVMGISGAFFTGDIFNLFVFFEVLLLASYALLIHAGGKQKTQASLHYLILNLIGSSLFLFALGILYGTLGTLNIADMALKVRELPEAEQQLARIGGLLLLIVFGLKSAMFPLHFWLTKTYSSASAPVAALFAIMTKVGIYSIWRIHTVVFGHHAGELANLIQPWLWPAAILTISAGTLGALASQSLRQLVSNLVIVSVGTMLSAVAINTVQATTAGLYYLIHSTLVTGALFLLADAIAEQRGKASDRFVRARRMTSSLPLGIAFAIGILSMTGLPPFSGFVGKVLVLQSSVGAAQMAWVWGAVLIASLMSVIAASRGGSTLFWRISSETNEKKIIAKPKLFAIYFLLSASPLLVIFGGQVSDFTSQAALQLYQLGVQPELLLPTTPSLGSPE
ncbi:monovalent cation/H+ antiporter subunit D [Neptunomonas phycophila]|uniref:monovalent cation/H+ antiporter subunit D n=1 Tax=Neptunomonas phycophila TaxID=1572645 RepID=UPI000948D457|nr:monovalent cation/H+ antiporter subunit D [Neptunomonas phycophila]QLE96578.1 monovalent cation/H+ antiporter subunit D [Neptunomonas phycophila]